MQEGGPTGAWQGCSPRRAKSVTDISAWPVEPGVQPSKSNLIERRGDWHIRTHQRCGPPHNLALCIVLRAMARARKLVQGLRLARVHQLVTQSSTSSVVFEWFAGTVRHCVMCCHVCIREKPTAKPCDAAQTLGRNRGYAQRDCSSSGKAPDSPQQIYLVPGHDAAQVCAHGVQAIFLNLALVCHDEVCGVRLDPGDHTRF